MVQVKCIAQWLVKSEDSVSGSERKTEEPFLLGSISGMRIELRISHPKGEREHFCLHQVTPRTSCQRSVPVTLGPCHSFTPAMSDFYPLLVQTPRVGRNLNDDEAQPLSLSAGFSSVPPGSPLQKHFLLGNLRGPQDCPSHSVYFPPLPENKHTLPT